MAAVGRNEHFSELAVLEELVRHSVSASTKDPRSAASEQDLLKMPGLVWDGIEPDPFDSLSAVESPGHHFQSLGIVVD